MRAPTLYSASLGALIATVAALCICADARAETPSSEPVLPVDVTQMVQEALAEVPLPEDVTALVEQAATPSPAAAPGEPEPAAATAAAPPPPPQPQPAAPSPVKPVRYQPVQSQYRAATPLPARPAPVAPPTPPAASEPAPRPAPRPAPPPNRAASPAPSPPNACDTEQIRGLLGLAAACDMARRLSANSVREFVERYQLLLEQYHVSIAVELPIESAQTATSSPEAPALSTEIEIPVPEGVAELPEAVSQPVVGLLSPQPARHALPPAARELGRPPPPAVPPAVDDVAAGARAVAAPAEARRAPPDAAAPADRPARAERSPTARPAPREARAERPARPAPLDLRSAAGTAPSGSSASAGGSSSAGGAVLAATLLTLFLALLDLLRRLRLEPALPRSQRVDSFPERPG